MSGAIMLSENPVKSIQSWSLEDSFHVSTKEEIGNHSKFVSKVNLPPDLNGENS